ncbi:hypothetical protein SK128_021286 [Halocaridina rubra]|uniref:Uncharacterized protein n=1 Tax=Halocaridina rubra TaxID=373956 RepID=A0AAN8ZTH0_HALRR
MELFKNMVPAAIAFWIFISSFTGGVKVLEFQKDRVATLESRGIYEGHLDKERRIYSLTLCSRFQLYILHGWATFFHLEDTQGRIMMLAGELWVERVRPVIARNWNFQILKQPLWMFRWYHLCFTYNHTQSLIKTYINGELSNEQEYNIGEPVYGDKLTLGQGATPERSFSGMLTQVNVWDRELSIDEIASISSCKNDPKGNYISWDAGWKFLKITSVEQALEDFCQNEDTYIHFIFPNMAYNSALFICQALGTDLPKTDDLDIIGDVWRMVNKTYPSVLSCAKNYWTSITDSAEEGIWRYQNGQIPEEIPWRKQEPNGLHYENCATISDKGISDVDCKTDKQCVVCTFRGQHRLSLLGTCETELRNVFLIAYQTNAGELSFMGYGEYYIRREMNEWVWMNDVKNETIARMEDTNPNFPMGRRWWKLEKSVCGQKAGDRKKLLLTPCGQDQFTCDDGACIEHKNRCDLKYDCLDNSDEQACTLVAMPTGYQRHLPPRSSSGEDESLPVIIFVNIESITVRTMDMTMEVSYEITLTWEDNRLQYLNLKWNSTLNVLPIETMKSLWTPKVRFVNSNDNHHTIVDDDSRLIIERRSDFKTRNTGASFEDDVYSGKVNTLSIRRKYGTIYNCDFTLEMYPFDVQECSMKFRIISASKYHLVFDVQKSSVQNSGESQLAEYNVGELALVNSSTGTFSEVHVLVNLRRLSGYAFLNIYIPTMVLLVISYITLFIRVSEFDVRLMGALTVQLVIATLFSQVSIYEITCSGSGKLDDLKSN